MRQPTAYKIGQSVAHCVFMGLVALNIWAALVANAPLAKALFITAALAIVIGLIRAKY